jgi:hypothetical protein
MLADSLYVGIAIPSFTSYHLSCKILVNNYASQAMGIQENKIFMRRLF